MTIFYLQCCRGQAEASLHLPRGETAGAAVRGRFPERARLRRRLREAALLRQGDDDHVLVLVLVFDHVLVLDG